MNPLLPPAAGTHRAAATCCRRRPSRRAWYRELARRGLILDDQSESLTSKDIDFRAAPRTVQRAAALLGATARLSSIDDHTPSTGLVLFLDSQGQRRQIDFLDAPYGLNARDVVETAQHVVLADHQGEVPVVVIHPQRLMESRVHGSMPANCR